MFIIGSKPICEKIKLLINTKKQVFCNISMIQCNIQEVEEINLYYNIHVHRAIDYFKNHNSCKIDEKLKDFIYELNITQFKGKELVSWEYIEKFFNIIEKYYQKIKFLTFDCFEEDYYNCFKIVNEKKCINFLQFIGMNDNIKENQQLCMGTIAIINEVMEKNILNLDTKIELIGFELNPKNSHSKKSLYHNFVKGSYEHTFSTDIDILLWLHKNNFIDATYCFVEFINEKVILDTRGLIEANNDSIKKLKKIYPEIIIK